MMNIFGFPINITNPIGWLRFISLALFLLLYFLKPKPVRKVIPSLLFIEQSDKKSSLFGFFGQFVKDWLFFVHLFIFLLLCLSTLSLFTRLDLPVVNKDVVFVIDTSASSNVIEDGKTRLSTSIDLASDNLGFRNSIILAKGTPEIIAKQTNLVNAYRLLHSIKPSYTTSNIWDAILMAGDLSESGTKVVVISDFVDTSGKDAMKAKEILASKGVTVRLINTGKSSDNVGFIDFKIQKDSKAALEIKNFGNSPADVEFDGAIYSFAPHSVEVIPVDLSGGMNTFEIKTDDKFSVDDSVRIYLPPTKVKKVLVLTNHRGTYAQTALSSISNLEIEIAEPPIVPDITHDIIVFDQVKEGTIITGVMDDIKKRVMDGGALVILAQPKLSYFNFKGMSPVNIETLENASTPVINTASLIGFTDIQYGLANMFFKTTLVSNSTVVLAETVGEAPLITLTRLGKGYVYYYGLFDDVNSFKYSTDYPVFWYETIKAVTKEQSASTFNLKIGDIIHGGESDVIAPDGSRHAGYSVADQIGVYKAGTSEYAVNLLNSRESDILNEKALEYDTMFDEALDKRTAMQDIDLFPILISIVIGLLLLDLFIIKRRGDL